jgi:RNA polymerase sigma-70 factor, ECF subfamily
MHASFSRPTPGLADDIAACGPELLLSARQLVGPHEADDLIQNTLERALKRQDTFQPNTNLVAWLRRIMSNLVVDSWRHQNRYPRCALDLQEPVAPDPEPPAAWEDLSSADLRAAIAELKPAFRDVFELYCRGLPYNEIARRLGIPMGTVGTRLLRGRSQLRVRLGETISLRAAAALAVTPMVAASSAARPPARDSWGDDGPLAVSGAA